MNNPFSLENKTILITGASSGIGKQCALDCSKMGANVIMVARNDERLNETLSQMEGEGHMVYSYDLSELDGIKQLISTIVSNSGKLDGFIHAAGMEISKPIKLLSHEDYMRLYSVNTLSGFEIIRQISSVRNINKGASLVLIASITAVIGRGSVAAYAASKGAMVSASRTFALEFASRQIRVNCISPGTILTPMMQNYFDTLDEDAYEKRIDGFPLGLGECSDISNACIYLLSDASRWVTGQNLVVDGGYTIR